MRRFPPVFLLVAALACGADGTDPETDAGRDASNFDEPRDDVVPAIGSDATFELATWNIENFPRAAATPSMVADLITSMDLDMVALQEVEDTAAFDELVARLPEHRGLLSTHTYSNGSYQKVGFVYRSPLVALEGGTLLFSQDGYAFPRPPLQVLVTVDNGTAPALDFVAITMHLKAGRDFEDRERREAAMLMLEQHITTSATALDADVVVLGDFNEVVTSSGGRAVFDPFLDQPGAFTLVTDSLAQGGAFSFVPSGSVLDHMLSTSSLDDERAGGTTSIPLLHTLYSPYSGSVSDHLPVVTVMPIF